MKFVTSIFIIFIMITNLYSKDQEAGQYTRKSITYLNYLLVLDNSDSHQQVATDIILGELKSDVMLARFDYNPIAKPIERKFINSVINSNVNWRGGDSLVFSNLSTIIDTTILTSIKRTLEINSEIRAQKMLTEQQRNSFITDKAKELGITEYELQTAMNSAFILIPVVRNIHSSKSHKTDLFSVSFELGIIIYKVTVLDGNPTVTPIFQEFTFVSQSSVIGQNYQDNGKYLNYKEHAYFKAASQGSMNLKVAIMKLREFKLTAQITEDGALTVGTSLNRSNGVKVDDKYLIIESREDKDGNLVQKTSGWIRINHVANDKVKAKIISGQPYYGEIIKEFPRLPINLNFSVRNFPLSISPNKIGMGINNLKVSNSYGGELAIAYNLGRDFGVSNFYGLVIGAGGYGDASGEAYFPDNSYNNRVLSYFNYQVGLAFQKKFYVRRLSLTIEGGGSYKNTIFNTESNISDTHYSLANSTWGIDAKAGSEISLSPAISIGGSLGYSLAIPSNNWEYREYQKTKESYTSLPDSDEELNSSGIIWAVSLVWNPAKLKNNPFINIF